MKLGVEWNIRRETLEQLEHDTYLMHWQGQGASVDVVRTKLLHNMFGGDQKLTTRYTGDLGRLPDFQFALKPHLQCGNHRAAVY